MLIWKKHDIRCLIKNKCVEKIHFCTHFKGKIKNKVGIGSLKNDIISIYGIPDIIHNRPFYKKLSYTKLNLFFYIDIEKKL